MKSILKLKASAFYDDNIVFDYDINTGCFMMHDDISNINNDAKDYTEFKKQIYIELFHKLNMYLFSNYRKNFNKNNFDKEIKELLTHDFVVALDDAKNWKDFIKDAKLRQEFLNRCSESGIAVEVYNEYMPLPFINIDYKLRLKIKVDILLCGWSDSPEKSVNISNADVANKKILMIY